MFIGELPQSWIGPRLGTIKFEVNYLMIDLSRADIYYRPGYVNIHHFP